MRRISPVQSLSMSTIPAESTRFLESFVDEVSNETTTINVVTKSTFPSFKEGAGEAASGAMDFLGLEKFKDGKVVAVPALGEGGANEYIATVEQKDLSSRFGFSSLPSKLPAGTYMLKAAAGGEKDKEISAEKAAISWALGQYKFDKYKKTTSSTQKDESEEHKEWRTKKTKMVWPAGCDKDKVINEVAATYLIRDLISTPCDDMGPHHLQRVVEEIASTHGAEVNTIIGDELLEKNYPQIHAVGRAADAERAPRLIDMRWGSEGPAVTLVGKGVMFDTGGLNIKPGSSMVQMKKDMGGAAQVIGLAHWMMAEKLPIKLRVLVPAVENAISGNALRPGDIITARNGRTTEVTNTDAEGRLVLADALVEASSETPDLLVDFATLTGAARVALGSEIPAIFCTEDKQAQTLQRYSKEEEDQVWHMPLWQPYLKQMNSKIANMKNANLGGGGAGAITAALYLKEYIGFKDPSKKKDKLLWFHYDLNGYNPSARPGRPEGGEAMGVRAMFSYIKNEVIKN